MPRSGVGLNELLDHCSGGLIAKIAVRELLGRSERRVMQLSVMRDKSKSLAKLCVKLSCAVAHDGQAAALRWPVLGKGGDDHVAARLYRAEY